MRPAILLPMLAGCPQYDYSSDIKELSLRIEALEDRMPEAEGSIATAAEVDAVQQQAELLAEGHSTLEGSMSDLQDQTASLGGSVSDLQDQTASLEESVNGLQDQHDTMEGALADLEGRTFDLETWMSQKADPVGTCTIPKGSAVGSRCQVGSAENRGGLFLLSSESSGGQLFLTGTYDDDGSTWDPYYSLTSLGFFGRTCAYNGYPDCSGLSTGNDYGFGGSISIESDGALWVTYASTDSVKASVDLLYELYLVAGY